MERLFEKSKRLIQNVSMEFQRSLLHEIKWDWRLVSLIGARGVGKTTLLLQQIKSAHGLSEEAIYISLDDIYFTQTSLSEFADAFYKRGGKALYIDEVHKYPDWARAIKNLYDFYPNLKIVFTGSSIIELLKQDVDLSRRALLHELHGLSFREYLKLSGRLDYPKAGLEELLNDHIHIAAEITAKIKPLQHFRDYLQVGYYPFFLEGKEWYSERLEQAIRLVIESDLDFIPGYDPRNARKIYQLFYLLSRNVPFKPNIAKLSEKIGVHRNTLIQYLHHLERARLIHALYPSGISVTILQKPEKLFLHNTNIAYAISPQQVDAGSLRETFALSQLRPHHELALPKKGDFLVADRYTLEVGGAGKTRAQIQGLPDAYLLADDIEIGSANKIPLWLAGFLY
jgi:predicted AAA+ superfamily ATPase